MDLAQRIQNLIGGVSDRVREYLPQEEKRPTETLGYKLRQPFAQVQESLPPFAKTVATPMAEALKKTYDFGTSLGTASEYNRFGGKERIAREQEAADTFAQLGRSDLANKLYQNIKEQQEDYASHTPQRVAQGALGTLATFLGASQPIQSPARFGQFATASSGLGALLGGGPALFSSASKAIQGQPLSREEQMSPLQGAQQGATSLLARSPLMFGALQGTGQFLGGTYQKYGLNLQRALSKVPGIERYSQQIMQRVIPSVLNVVEGIAIDPVIGYETDAQSILLDATMGLVFGPGSIVPKDVEATLRKVNPDVSKQEVSSVTDKLKSIKKAIESEEGFVRLGPEDSISRMKSEAIKQLDFLKNQDKTIPQNIGELINKIDVSSAKSPREAAEMILKNLPENVRTNATVKQAMNAWGKQFTEGTIRPQEMGTAHYVDAKGTPYDVDQHVFETQGTPSLRVVQTPKELNIQASEGFTPGQIKTLRRMFGKIKSNNPQAQIVADIGSKSGTFKSVDDLIKSNIAKTPSAPAEPVSPPSETTEAAIKNLTEQAGKYTTAKKYVDALRESGLYENNLGLVKMLGFTGLEDFYKKVSGKGGKGKLPKYAPMNFNLEQMNSPDDVKRFILDWRKSHNDLVEQAYNQTTGKNFMEEVRALAARSPISSPEKFIKRGKYDIESVSGKKQLLADFLALSELHKNLAGEMSAYKNVIVSDAPLDAKMQASAGLIANQSKMLSASLSLQGRSSLAGQFLNLHKQLKTALSQTEEGARMVQAEKVLKQQFGLSGEDLTKALEALSKIDQTNPDAMSGWLRDVAAIKGSKTSLLTSFFYNNILSSFPSHQANATGNTMSVLANELLVRPTALALEGRTPKQIIREVGPAYTGALNGIPKGLARALHIMKTNFDPEEVVRPDKWEAYRIDPFTLSSNPRVRAMGPALTVSSRALKGADAFFKNVLYESELQARISRLAMDQTKSTDPKVIGDASAEILTNLHKHQDIVKKAQDYSYYGTFNEAPAKITQLIEKIRTEAPVLRPVIPFIRIAGNLWKQGFVDWSPVGFAKNRPNLDAVQQSQMNARALIGTGLMATGASMFIKGDLTLDAPDTPSEKGMFYMNNQPYSVRIPVGGQMAIVPLRRLEPWINPFLTGAIIARDIQEGRKTVEEGEATAMDAVTATTKNIIMDTGSLALDSSYVQSLSSFADAFSGGFDAEYKLDQFIGQTFAGFTIPFSGMWRSIAYALDPTLRKAEGPAETVMTQLPYLSKQVQPRVTPFGEEAQRAGGRWSGFLFVRPTIERNDPALKELTRLEVNVGLATPKIKDIDLEGESKTKYQKLSGNVVHFIVLQTMLSPGYNELTDDLKKQVLERQIGKARDIARKAWLGNIRTFEDFSERL